MSIQRHLKTQGFQAPCKPTMMPAHFFLSSGNKSSGIPAALDQGFSTFTSMWPN